MVVGGGVNRPWKRWPPGTTVSLQTSFFIAWSGLTQGPPVSLQPAEEAMVISRSSLSASSAVCRNTAFHSGDM